MAVIVGIDFGTTNSLVAMMEGGTPTIVPTADGRRSMPSVVAINPKTGEWLVGRPARNQGVINPENTVFSIKRLIGRKFNESEVQKMLKLLPYKLKAAANGDVQVIINNVEYDPVDLCAMIFDKLKAAAEVWCASPIDKAVITVPAYFNRIQRNAIEAAGKIANLEVLRLIHETSAAAIAYGLGKHSAQSIAVYAFGGGAFDISILEVGDDVFEVKSTNSDPFLGGDDFDECIMVWMLEEFKQRENVDLRLDRQALQRLREAAENAKKELSNALVAEINIPFIMADATGAKHLALKLNRAKFEALTAHLISKSMQKVKMALDAAGYEAATIDQIVLVGSLTRMPAIQEELRKFFNKVPNSSINPDEVVTIGAAIQAGILSGEIRDMMLLDVTPLSLSVETLGGVARTLIERDTTIPVKKSQVFSTTEDDQTQVEIHVVQGERPMVADNKSLGRFILSGIRPEPRGTPQIEVTLDIDANGVINASAIDKVTGNTRIITLVADSSSFEAELPSNVSKGLQLYDHSNVTNLASPQDVDTAELSGIPSFSHTIRNETVNFPQPDETQQIAHSNPYIFLSHATRNDSVVDRIHQELYQRGFQTFVDHNDISPGMDWDSEVQSALKTTDAMVLVLSEASVASSNVKDEWFYYLEEKKPIIIAVIEKCERPFRLRRFQYVDFEKSGFDTGLEKLLEGVTTSLENRDISEC